MECIDTLIGDIVPPAELMKTQTDRKIADEMQRTYEVQREAQMQRQKLERETAVANMQAEVVRSEQMVQIQKNAPRRSARRPRADAAQVHAARRPREPRHPARGDGDAPTRAAEAERARAVRPPRATAPASMRSATELHGDPARDDPRSRA